MNINAAMQMIALCAIPLIFAITLHEAAHGWVASKFGDTTALMLGRVTLNPVKHIDPIGTILVPILMLIFSGFIFGWAKPVPVNFNNLKNPRRDMMLVALAGPAANLLMALLWATIAKLMLFVHVGATHPVLKTTATFLHLSAQFGILINCVLLLLNLLPIPPLDGSRVVSSILPNRIRYAYEKIEPYGIWILIGLFLTGILAHVLFPAIYLLSNTISAIFHLQSPQSFLQG